MLDRANVIYCYDGTFNGLMCCVFEAYEAKELPAEIKAGEPDQMTFLAVKSIPTVPEKFNRVLASIPRKMGPDALFFLQTAFLSCDTQKELRILEFMETGYDYGTRVMNMPNEPVFCALNKMVLHCEKEAHHLKGFLRFSDNGGALAAVIEPKNCVLPLIAEHFTDRYRNENFLIYDKTHRMALVYSNYVPQLMTDVDFELPETTDQEEYYRALWKEFYNSIGIKERFNPRCRMNLMPKRYWSNMPEMSEELYKPQNAPRPSGLSSFSNSRKKLH